jgi:hypothetical protein
MEREPLGWEEIFNRVQGEARTWTVAEVLVNVERP